MAEPDARIEGPSRLSRDDRSETEVRWAGFVWLLFTAARCLHVLTARFDASVVLVGVVLAAEADIRRCVTFGAMIATAEISECLQLAPRIYTHVREEASLCCSARLWRVIDLRSARDLRHYVLVIQGKRVLMIHTGVMVTSGLESCRACSGIAESHQINLHHLQIFFECFVFC